MAKLPPDVRGERLRRALERAGFVLSRQRGVRFDYTHSDLRLPFLLGHTPTDDRLDFSQKQTKLRDGIFGVGRDGQAIIAAD